MRALLIEDNQVVSDSIRTMLVPEDYAVDTVAFGEDGLAAAQRGGHDVIILDLMLPDIDGHDVLCRLRQSGIESPILVLSGLEEAENRDKCLDNGADEYMSKPLKRKEFLSSLDSLTRRQGITIQAPSEAGWPAVNLDTNTFLMMYR